MANNSFPIINVIFEAVSPYYDKRYCRLSFGNMELRLSDLDKCIDTMMSLQSFLGDMAGEELVILPDIGRSDLYVITEVPIGKDILNSIFSLIRD